MIMCIRDGNVSKAATQTREMIMTKYLQYVYTYLLFHFIFSLAFP